MVYRALKLFLVALALALFVGTPVLADDKNAGDTHQGTVVSVTATKLVMKAKDGTEHSHTLAANARVVCDGKECKLDDLKPGQKIRVTTKKGDKETATKVEALDKNEKFEKSDGQKQEKG
jgi:hypothetical protein